MPDDLHVTYRDLAASPISHLSGAYLAGQSPEVQHDQAMQEDLQIGGKVLEEFLAADVVVIGVALYNFTDSQAMARQIRGINALESGATTARLSGAHAGAADVR